MPARDEMWIDDMLQACRDAAAFISGRSRSDLDSDRQLELALAKVVEIIGEAAANLSDVTRNSMSEVPWSDIIRMRNRLIHAYFHIDRNVLWDAATIHIPSLQNILVTRVRIVPDHE